jgi:hypothetical protein
MFIFIFLCLGFVSAQSSARPWTPDQLQDPEALANIKGATEIGPTKDKHNLAKLKQALSAVPKDKTIIIYCGCCPISVCPNIRPAFELLKEMKFTRPKLLNLSHNLKTNWIDPGFPME